MYVIRHKRSRKYARGGLCGGFVDLAEARVWKGLGQARRHIEHNAVTPAQSPTVVLDDHLYTRSCVEVVEVALVTGGVVSEEEPS